MRGGTRGRHNTAPCQHNAPCRHGKRRSHGARDTTIRICKKAATLRIAAFLRVVPGGFEPPQTEPKPVVLPLHHRTIVLFDCKGSHFLRHHQIFGMFLCSIPQNKACGPLPCAALRVTDTISHTALCLKAAKKECPCSRHLSHGDEIIVFLATLHEQILACYEVFLCHHTVKCRQLLLVERHATALHELAHLAL